LRWLTSIPPKELAGVLGIYLGTRVVQFVLIGWLGGDGSIGAIKERLLIWDATWFVRVAVEGYPHGYSYDQGVMVGNGLAFFPLYPLCIRVLWWLGLSAWWAALLVSLLAGVAAAIVLYRLGAALKDRRVGFALVALFFGQPMSVALSMGYSEALFSALVIGMFYAAYRRAFIWAGFLGLAASLTRPPGLAAAIALAVAAVMAGFQPSPRLATETGSRAAPRRLIWRPVIGACLALVGVPAYLLWVALRVGHLNAWFTIQTAGWGTTFDFGSSSLDFVWTALSSGQAWVQVSVAFIMIAAVVLAVVAIIQRTWLPITVYGLLALGLVVGQAGYYHSKPRLLVPVLLVLFPLGYAAGRSRPRAAALALTGYCLFGLWYGAYLITVWHYTI
jgi:hypothetical protein